MWLKWGRPIGNRWWWQCAGDTSACVYLYLVYVCEEKKKKGTRIRESIHSKHTCSSAVLHTHAQGWRGANRKINGVSEGENPWPTVLEKGERHSSREPLRRYTAGRARVRLCVHSKRIKTESIVQVREFDRCNCPSSVRLWSTILLNVLRALNVCYRRCSVCVRSAETHAMSPPRCLGTKRTNRNVTQPNGPKQRQILTSAIG